MPRGPYVRSFRLRTSTWRSVDLVECRLLSSRSEQYWADINIEQRCRYLISAFELPIRQVAGCLCRSVDALFDLKMDAQWCGEFLKSRPATDTKTFTWTVRASTSLAEYVLQSAYLRKRRGVLGGIYIITHLPYVGN